MNPNNTNSNNDQQFPTNVPRKKCHGNRRNQRFRRKCRAKGMKPKIIEKLLMKRRQAENQNHNNTNHTNMQTTESNQHTTDINNSSKSTSINPNKRKRDITSQELKSNSTLVRSTSQSSTCQPLSKKIKEKNKTILNSSIQSDNNTNNRKYRLVNRRLMYLKRLLPRFFKRLSKLIDYPLKGKVIRDFLCARLELFDQQYCLTVDQQLWQSYLKIGLEYRLWPNQLYNMTKTTDFELCRQYVINYIKEIDHELNSCQMKLKEETQSCPVATLPLEQIDSHMKEFVEKERQYVTLRNNDQLTKFKDDLQTQQLFQTISQYHLTFDHMDYLNKLMAIRNLQGEIWDELLILYMRVLCNFLSPNFNELEQFISPNIYSPIIQNRIAIQVKNNRMKIIKEAKRIWLNIALKAYEVKLQEYDQQYQSIWSELKSLLFNDTTINGSAIFNHLNEYMTSQTTKLKSDIRRNVASYRYVLLQNRQRSVSSKNTIRVSPEPYLDLLKNPFNEREWNYLCLGYKFIFFRSKKFPLSFLLLGPSFIRLNQSAIRPVEEQEAEIKNEHEEITKKVQGHLNQYHHIPPKSSILKEYSNEVFDHFNRSYFTPLSSKEQIEAFEQAQMTASIREKLKKNNLILRLTDKGNNFYVGSAGEFEQKGEKFFQETNAFIEISINPLNQIQDQVIQLLNRLRSKRLILEWQYKKMMPDRNNSELAHLYFNPKTHKEDIPVRPIESTIHSSTRNISQFLDTIIRPIFDDKCASTTIIDGTSLIKELLKYIKKGLFKSTTLFCTFDIRNLYTMLPQEEALDILVEFLQFYGYTKVKGIDLKTIRELAAIILKENVFVYGNKIYQQVLGGAMGSSFTLSLANIFMWKWQKDLVRRQDMTGEFYGRYIDDIFMTWNKSEETLQDLLHQANTWHPNIKLEYKIGKNLPFLDVFFTNNNGILTTSVYHKPAAEPYVVPFLSDHPRHVFVNVIQTSLARAARYSSTLEIFNNERRCIQLSLLYNG
ncbi:unnamed protein product [Rotaria sp. Silwood1]|nr:unnamed protein product [Rotaria sp. Silwood1]CAF1639263.1 unnamed protein product [Rotaria sp. Silwood1]CAF3794433.1 unnamed protein product [Rotaria sp. Silwood1]CAF3844060.1 unnamed protein product [Rotaria sp. Silwood1]